VTFFQPLWLLGLLAWNFVVLAAVQLTIRLIMAFSIRTTVLGAVVLTLLALPIGVVYELLLGPQPTVSTRLNYALVPMVLMAAAGFVVARWVLKLRRLRGQVVAAIMVGVLDPHLFTLLA
jgi:hypothetical protein